MPRFNVSFMESPEVLTKGIANVNVEKEDGWIFSGENVSELKLILTGDCQKCKIIQNPLKKKSQYSDMMILWTLKNRIGQHKGTWMK